MRSLAILSAVVLSMGAQAQGPAAVLKSPDEIEWKVSGSLPPARNTI